MEKKESEIIIFEFLNGDRYYLKIEDIVCKQR